MVTLKILLSILMVFPALPQEPVETPVETPPAVPFVGPPTPEEMELLEGIGFMDLDELSDEDYAEFMREMELRMGATIGQSLDVQGIFSKPTFDERVTEFIRLFNAHPLLRNRPTREELAVLIADGNLQTAATVLRQRLSRNPIEGMNEKQVMNYVAQREPYYDAAYRLARQILRQDAGLPIMRDLFTFDYITEFNLDVLLLLSRWLHNPDEREALAFLFSSFGGYFNPSFFDNLKFNRDWAYQGANGAKWGIIASALAMITHGSVKGFQGVRTWFRERWSRQATTTAPAATAPTATARNSTNGGSNGRNAGRPAGAVSVERDPIFRQMEENIVAIGRVFNAAPARVASTASRRPMKMRARLNAHIIKKWAQAAGNVAKNASIQSFKGLAIVAGAGVAGGAAMIGWRQAMMALDPDADMDDTYMVPLDALMRNYTRLAALELQCRAIEFHDRLMAAEQVSFEDYEEYMELATQHGILLRLDPSLTEILDITDSGRYRFSRLEDDPTKLRIEFPVQITEQRDQDGKPIFITIPESERVEVIDCPQSWQVGSVTGLDIAKERLSSAVMAKPMR